ncbi:hypothetical protein [Gilvibacter sp.]|uniref:hypothetical protein n=1 Tax=Gilvibacter sp. TaxID=2729997 RepID=UPI0025C01666|nr:hypothetical protein [Gilvibacter sp.]NQX76435.1 hypothetical protein [Gilvibacter sp.]
MKPLLALFALAFCLSASCISSQQATTSEADKAAKTQMMTEAGFTAATVIVQPQEAGCPVVIKLENEYLDPIDLKEEFKIDQLEVWVKFSRLRRMNRCDMAGPVSISEIQKKAE